MEVCSFARAFARTSCVMRRNICTTFSSSSSSFSFAPSTCHARNESSDSIHLRKSYFFFFHLFIYFFVSRKKKKQKCCTLQFNTFNGVRVIFNKLQYLRCWSVFHLTIHTVLATTTMATWRHACNSATLATRAHMQFDAVNQCTNNANQVMAWCNHT